MNPARLTVIGWLSIGVLLTATIGARADPPRYRIADLGMVGQEQADSMDDVRLNARGHVVLTLPTGAHDGLRQPITHAFLWKDGQRRDLGVLPGYVSMTAADLNDLDAVVGWADRPAPNVYAQSNYASRAFLWAEGRLIDIGRSAVLVNDNTTDDSYAASINDKGQVAGWYLAFVPRLPGEQITTPFMFLYQNGRWASAGHGTAQRMNAQGDVVGSFPGFAGSAYSQHAMLFSHGRKRDLGTLHRRALPDFPGLSSEARGLNRRGDVVGSSDTDATVVGEPEDHISHGFLWRSGRMYDLDAGRGRQESGANAVNDLGVIVGYFTQGKTERACLWRRGRRSDLNGLVPAGSGWRLRIATDINGRGQIVGHGRYRGSEHAFLLTRR